MIILHDVTDSLLTLTRRTIKSFKFALKEFSFSYVLKCDDDMFVDLRRIASDLQLRKSHIVYIGAYNASYCTLGHTKRPSGPCVTHTLCNRRRVPVV